MGRTYSHIVFALKNSRYDFQKIRRKKTAGFISPTFPFLEGREEEMLVDVLCNVAYELDLKIFSLNFCGDHVHAIIISDSHDLSKLMMLWKGKTSYNFNRWVNPSVENQPAIKSDGTKQGLWAKSYFQKVLKNDEELQNVINYIKNNRKKHGLEPLSNITNEIISKLLSNI
jgi:REP element-mobilizing transposase RayT